VEEECGKISVMNRYLRLWPALIFLVFLSYAEAETLSRAETRIVGGNAVDPNDKKWEFIVSLRYYNTHYCGGSLIAPQWVVTAAHCWWNNQTNQPMPVTSHDEVGVGSYAQSGLTDYAIDSVYVNPLYDPNLQDNDIALIKLATPVSGIHPARLMKSFNLVSGIESWVAGWGITEYGGLLSNDLMEVSVPLIDIYACASDSDYQTARESGYAPFSLTTNMICAGYMEGGKDSCQGDSGGPLISKDGNQWVLTGIVSWGEGCAEANKPGVYTNIRGYSEWIESYTGKIDLSSQPRTVVIPF